MRIITLGGLIALLTSGCAANPPDGSQAYKDGALGNGAFVFECDDSVACDGWRANNARRFPDQIASGSSFNVRFVANDNQGTVVVVNGTSYTGVTSKGLEPYLSGNTQGVVARQPGYGTIVATDVNGSVIDYATIKIAKPDGLVVYDAAYKGNDPPRVQAINLKNGDSKKFRTVTEMNKSPLAGMIQTEWKSDDESILQVESYSAGVVTIVAKNPGKTTITAVGAAQEKTIEVEVKP